MNINIKETRLEVVVRRPLTAQKPVPNPGGTKHWQVAQFEMNLTWSLETLMTSFGRSSWLST